MMWNPPWALVLVTPLGLLPANAAHFVWLAGQLAAVLAAAGMLWRVYRGPRDLWPVGCAVSTVNVFPFAQGSGFEVCALHFVSGV